MSKFKDMHIQTEQTHNFNMFTNVCCFLQQRSLCMTEGKYIKKVLEQRENFGIS